MAVLDAELVQRLARRRNDGPSVSSLYLNVDGRQNIRPEDFRMHLDALVREALAKGQPEGVFADFERLKQHVADFDRGNIRGLAIFVAGDGLWQTVELPVAISNSLVVNATPHVRQLEAVLDEYEPVGVLLTDKQRARLFVLEFGRIVEREEFVDPLPRHDDDKGDWGKDHVKSHSNNAAGQHLRHAAKEMFELYKRHHFVHLVLGIAEELAPELERQLHAYLRTRVIGRCTVPIGANDEEITAAVMSLAHEAERAREAEHVERLRDSMAGAGASSAVAGLDPTLRAIFEKRVETLLVSEGFTQEGWRCDACRTIATLGRKCPACEAEMHKVDDVVEEAVEDALAQKCRVEFCNDNVDLDVLGRIGALLRF